MQTSVGREKVMNFTSCYINTGNETLRGGHNVTMGLRLETILLVIQAFKRIKAEQVVNGSIFGNAKSSKVYIWYTFRDDD